MAFNDLRKLVADTTQANLGEPVTLRPAAGGAFPTVAIIHRLRSASIGDSRQQRNPSMAQSVQTATIYRDNGATPEPRTDDAIELTGSGEIFKVAGQAVQRDEYKTVVPIRGPVPV